MTNYIGSEQIERVALIGMAGRFPGARSVEDYWQNLRDGVESVTHFSDEDLLSRGVGPSLLNHRNYVKAGGFLEDVDLFDASFFGLSPGEARVTDPQHRLLVESAWEALENAGYNPEHHDGSIGVYAGTGVNNYLRPFKRGSFDPIASYRQMIGNDKDFLATRVSYLLDLKGPSLTVQTACSTSLVAVHLACQSLLTYQCDMALAGGVSIRLPQGTGYVYEDGMILSPDGHCRAFDAHGRGIVPGNGLGMVVLKRYSEAVADGDQIRAVIRGSAINNDGAGKVGYTAPSIDGQAEAVATALTLADVEPETVGYIEAHGTGTPLGDPIELSALTKVFRASTHQKRFCAIGSAKTNIGHLDTAAGIAGLIKTVLALENEQIPPSLNFKDPNPEIDWDSSPFYVNDSLKPWPRGAEPRRAGVSSFGIGGTNAHVVVEEAPSLRTQRESGRLQLLLLSSRTPSALEQATANLRHHLSQNCDINLADVAYTLQVGRKRFDHRRVLVASTVDEAIASLEHTKKGGDTLMPPQPEREIVFVFPGQGSQYVNMGLDLYRTESVFREQVDHAAAVLKSQLGLDIRTLIFPAAEHTDKAADQLRQTSMTQPALFVVEYALARLWMSWGIRPHALGGHSVGEYVAACLAGVFSLEDALALLSARGRLMQGLPAGSMLAVPLSERDVVPLLGERLSLAAVNGPRACVVSGEADAIRELERTLSMRDIAARHLHTSHAFHSHLMDPILDTFAEAVSQAAPQAPALPFVSNVTGTWITPEEATAPRYWADHLRCTVRFADNLTELTSGSPRVLVEAGPGRTLTTLARRIANSDDHVAVCSLRHPDEEENDQAFILQALGNLWLHGLEPDWPTLHAEDARRIQLPTYPFERQRYWSEEPRADVAVHGEPRSSKLADLDQWFYVPSWERTGPEIGFTRESDVGQSWLVLCDGDGTASRVTRRVRERMAKVSVVTAGPRFSRSAHGIYTINPRSPADYRSLVESLHADDAMPDLVAHFWLAGRSNAIPTVESAQPLGFYSLVYLVQALDRKGIAKPIKLSVVTSYEQEVTDDDLLIPGKATVRGACKCIPQEYPTFSCQVIDVDPSEAQVWNERQLDGFINELASSTTAGEEVAYRGRYRWLRRYTPIPLERQNRTPQRLRERGVYLITGGMGGVGSALAELLAREVDARLILVGRSEYPPKHEWAHWVSEPDSDKRIRRGIEKALQLEALGAEVLLLTADVADINQMTTAVRQAEQQFGSIHGVIHAAGIVPPLGAGAIQTVDQQACEKQFRAKIDGLMVLDQLLAGKALDFCLVTSSLSTVLGGLGLCAYAAANAFMDAHVCSKSKTSGIPWITINWDGWQLDAANSPSATSLNMTRSEGLETFRRILSLGQAPRLVVSTGSLQPRLDKWVRLNRSAGRATNRPQTGERADNGHTSQASCGQETISGRTGIQQMLSTIWQTRLGLDRVGVHDDFYELGGDSLLGMSIVADCKKAGIQLTPQQLFESPTIAQLAGVAEKLGQRVTAHSVESGEVPLAPNVYRFLVERESPALSHWNVAVLLETPPSLNLAFLHQAFKEILRHHDALRLRFTRDASGWRQRIVEPDEEVPFEHYDLSGTNESLRAQCFQELLSKLQGSLDIGDGPIVRLVHFDLGDHGRRILFHCHHFAADGVSLPILLEDLESAYLQLARGDQLQLPPRTTSLKHWAERLKEYGQSAAVREHAAYWMSRPWSDVSEIPYDLRATEHGNSNASALAVRVSLRPDETEGLLKLAGTVKASAEDLLAAALAWSLAEWTSNQVVLFDRIGHGRGAFRSDIDLSRTVGFFLSYTPLVLRVPARREPVDLDEVIAQIRLGKDRWISFDVLRRMSGDEGVAAQLRATPRAQVLFNFRSKSNPLAPHSLFSVADEEVETTNYSPRGLRYYPLGVVADLLPDGLEVRFVYSSSIHREETITTLAVDYIAKLRELLSAATAPARRSA